LLNRLVVLFVFVREAQSREEAIEGLSADRTQQDVLA
jgi:hypothetical protein